MSAVTVAADPPTRKGESTRKKILESALRLFRERGYDGTTMRSIAADAGVSLGNAYYYFTSKDHLIHAYYARSHVEHLAACKGVLETEPDLERRLREVLRLKISTSEPYHRFATQLFKTAADPTSPLSPFSDDSLEVRRQSTELMRRIVEGSSTSVTGDLAERLPELLWTYQMGIILYWIHDGSPGRARTYRLIDHTTSLVVRLIKISRLPPVRPLVRRSLQLLDELTSQRGRWQ